jgi:hypothetical protein
MSKQGDDHKAPDKKPPKKPVRVKHDTKPPKNAQDPKRK